ncbi:MAG TPA: phosphonoacetaldehyde hydrolase [Paraburkholderia sp.]|uniref:phosphonoacetaldehyde hydrolase n=1 Tax=Paraburkholderia sp. TaxID=1926495 RepID=UPI002BEDB3BB|nr:phosphonoacetaldehyde hydrolase [Paraburkholderia sp.]HTR06111.1 phosphonoacetaldehyde hydrolase [Paraburkholderia sp.]
MKHVKAVIFDWAGTVVDYGSRAPMGAFVETFEEFGVPITIEEARGPMGMAKRPHIAALLALPRVAAAWEARYGHAPGEADIDAVYDVFVPKNIAVAAQYSDVIPGVAAVTAALRAEGVRIGSTTGYTREIIDQIVPGAAAQGFEADSIVCTGDTPEGRPSPYMIYRTLPQLGVWRAREAIKVDDTEVGIEEGINGGTWAVGVAVSGNAFGLTEAEVHALAPDEFARRREAAVERLRAAGAHYVIDSVADLLPVVNEIDARLARGERP